MKSPQSIVVFYDGGCKICSFEMEGYKKQDTKDAIQLVDINHPAFKAPDHGMDVFEVRRVLHVQSSDGTLITGVPAFAAIWRALDRPMYHALADLSEKPLIKEVLNLGYRGFVRVRPWLPRKGCDGDSCSLSARGIH